MESVNPNFTYEGERLVEALLYETPANPMWVPHVISQEAFEAWARMHATYVAAAACSEASERYDEYIGNYINQQAEAKVRSPDIIENKFNGGILHFLSRATAIARRSRVRWWHGSR